MPTPTPHESQILIWVMGLLITFFLGLIAYLLKKYIDNNDGQHAKTFSKLSEHDKNTQSLRIDVLKASEYMRNGISDLKDDNLEFQRKINDEILEIRKSLMDTDDGVQEVRTRIKIVEDHVLLSPHLVPVRK